ncbi:MAG: hypothetical protein IIC22_09645 [Chloroflexi bacterium]|nr:hypothetical protein [Chloroflexota bacterium]
MANEAKRDEQKPGKMVYEVPELKALGSLYEITKGPVGGAIDGLFGNPGGFIPGPHVTPS